ncbi:MAG: hypothetical protein ACO3EG_06375 [Chitinophagaceae bacterium]
MKKIILFCMMQFLCFNSFSQVQTRLNVNCFTLTQLAEILVDFKEEPLGIGKVMRGNSTTIDESEMILFVNIKTGSWTVTEKHKSGLYCVLSGGNNFNLINKGDPI